MRRLCGIGVIAGLLVTIVMTSWAAEPARRSKGVSIKGNTANLEKGFAFRETGKGAVQVVDAAGRYTVTIVCACGGKGGECRVAITPHAAICGGTCETCQWEEVK
jgi:hypothetical protein